VSVDLHAALEATWPPLRSRAAGPWTIREGAGGGKRVSAATADGDWSETDILEAEQAMHSLGQTPLFMVRAGEGRLDAALARRGYGALDPTEFHAAPVSRLAPGAASMTGFAHWPPLAIVSEIWTEAGIGAARQAVMERVAVPHAALLGRSADRPAGVAFVAVHGATAMLHALEVRPAQRRQGTARNLVGWAAVWAAQQGAIRLCLAVTVANAPARALYASLGMDVVGQYHYRSVGA
jgi:GNAT superfamily N-acetyltransferase